MPPCRDTPEKISSLCGVNGRLSGMTTGIEYTFELGEWIALEYAGGDTLKHIHECHADRCPAPLYVRRWRKRYPQFELLMLEAEETRAELFADEQLSIADDPRRQAAAASNAIAVRRWLAERMDRNRYSKTKMIDVNVHGTVDHRHMAQLTDEQLAHIAQGAITLEAQAEDHLVEQLPASDHELSSSSGAPITRALMESDPRTPPRSREVPSSNITSLVQPTAQQSPEKISEKSDSSEESDKIEGMRNPFD